jgi:hypothetical protein
MSYRQRTLQTHARARRRPPRVGSAQVTPVCIFRDRLRNVYPQRAVPTAHGRHDNSPAGVE